MIYLNLGKLSVELKSLITKINFPVDLFCENGES